MDTLQEIRERLDRLEARLAALEDWRSAVTRPVSDAERAQADAGRTSPGATAPVAPTSTPPPRPHPTATRKLPVQKSAAEDGNVAARWMAGGAAVAFLLAAVYLLRVMYDSGWLTPAREIGLAVLGGGVLIAAGLWIARFDRAYAAWLPAAGSVVLYIAAYGAHLYFMLIGRNAAIAAVGATSLLTLWLGRRFGHGIFVVFAVLGTYLFPLWLPTEGTPVADLVVYFAAWSIAFALAGLQEGRRLVYVLAMYCSLLGFQVVWLKAGNRGDWQPVALFQLIQFVLFALTAVAFSIRYRRAMDAADAVAHGVALFYFYAFEYALLHANAPALAAPLALSSALFVLIAYITARDHLPVASRAAGAMLASSYCAVVTAHILFLDWMPERMIPWAALVAPLFVVAARPLFRDTPAALTPVRLVAGFVFVVGFLEAMHNDAGTQIPLPDFVLFAYAAALYLGYAAFRTSGASADTRTALLYAGHVSAMMAFSRALDSGFAISVAWGLLALTLLVLAIVTRDRNLGRSSLIVFAASGLKTLLVDLHDSDPLLRVLTLLVLGASLYAGGWLYQRVFRTPDTTESPRNP